MSCWPGVRDRHVSETVDDIMFVVVVFFVRVHLCVTLFSLLYFLAVMFWYCCSGGNLMSLGLIKWNSVSCSVHRVSFNLSICKRLCFHTNTQTHTPAWWQENAWYEKRRDVMSLSNDGWVILACDSSRSMRWDTRVRQSSKRSRWRIACLFAVRHARTHLSGLKGFWWGLIIHDQSHKNSERSQDIVLYVLPQIRHVLNHLKRFITSDLQSRPRGESYCSEDSLSQLGCFS